MTKETPAPPRRERWALTREGRAHEVTVAEQGWRRRVTWLVDGVEVASKATSEERVVLAAPADGEAGPEAVRVWLPTFVGPTRRVALFDAGEGMGARERAEAGLGGVEFVPESGSKAAKRQAWIRDHPTLYTLRQTAIAVAAVVIPLLIGSYVVRFALSIPWPDWLRLPAIPWPDISLPRIPWPDIPWPDITLPEIPWPEWSLPPWVAWLADNAKYVWPVILALVLARAEVRRRRKAADASGDAATMDFGPPAAGDSAPTGAASERRSTSATEGGPTSDNAATRGADHRDT